MTLTRVVGRVKSDRVPAGDWTQMPIDEPSLTVLVCVVMLTQTMTCSTRASPCTSNIAKDGSSIVSTNVCETLTRRSDATHF